MADKPTEEELKQAISLLERTGADLTRLFSEEEDEKEDLYDETYLRKLESAFASFSSAHGFKVGQIVKWKENMKNKKLPGKNQPAIVIEVMKEPLFDRDDTAGSTYFREPLDIILGVFAKEGEFITFHYDSRRFEPYS
ncbi:MAG: hypothetical protein V1792_14830 [Pseudomonadota bacterium]